MSDWFAALVAQLETLLASTGVLPIALVLFVEEMGIPSPIPGDLMMLLAGVRVAQGRASLASVLLLQELVTLAGAFILYSISRRAGRSLVLRYGHHLAFGPAQLARAEQRLHGHEALAIFVGRLIPGLRVLTVIAAGVANVHPAKFLPALAAGSFVNITLYTVLGMLIGPPVLRLVSRFSFPASVLWSLIGLALIALIIRAFRRAPPARSTVPPPLVSVLAGGFLAGIAGLLGANTLFGILNVVARLSGNTVRLGITRPAGELHFVLGWPVFLATAIACGLLHRWLRLRRVTPGLRLLLTTVLPAVATILLLVPPLRDMAGSDARETTRLVIISSALVRWSIFGLVVELLPLSVATRGPRDEAP